jgi:hypothetical protein
MVMYATSMPILISNVLLFIRKTENGKNLKKRNLEIISYIGMWNLRKTENVSTMVNCNLEVAIMRNM